MCKFGDRYRQLAGLLKTKLIQKKFLPCTVGKQGQSHSVLAGDVVTQLFQRLDMMDKNLDSYVPYKVHYKL